MLIENGYGKTYSMRVEDYLDLTDEDLQFIIAEGYGEQIEDPFIMPFSDMTSKKEINIEDINEIPDDFIEDFFEDSEK
jgi:hypothetical protein